MFMLFAELNVKSEGYGQVPSIIIASATIHNTTQHLQDYLTWKVQENGSWTTLRAKCYPKGQIKQG